MRCNTATSIIYALTAAAFSVFMLSRNLGTGGRWSVLFLLWLFVCAVPLLFVFAYPRFLFADFAPQNRRRYAALLNGVGAVTTTVLFSVLATPFWKNPVRDIDDSIPLALVPLAVLVVFFVAAIFLLLKNTSSLATLASILFWPYWLLLTLVFVDRWFQDTSLHASYYFLGFVAPVLFAFAAGTVSYRPTIAHAAAFMGLVGAPWLYWDVIRGSGYDNVWLMFNQPDNRFAIYPLYAVPAIFSIALIAFAIATAAVRLLPSHWHLRGFPLSARTWPGVVACFVVLAVWFTQSVMPYRIPGAVDYSGWPILQILHVEKRGLQFHESCINVWGRPNRPMSVSFSRNDRRLFQYRFQQKYASGKPPEDLVERIRAILKSSGRGKSDTVKPLRNWNADGWYFNVEGSGLKVYGTANGSPPPQEIVDLFHDLDKIPRSSETQSELKDVCLGFCYDPLSGLGSLYANHRCFNDGHGVVCR